VGRLKELSSVKDEYIKALVEELNKVVPLTSEHGWKSSRYEKGKELREKIKAVELKRISGIMSRPSRGIKDVSDTIVIKDGLDD
jgi:hypothetical protein